MRKTILFLGLCTFLFGEASLLTTGKSDSSVTETSEKLQKILEEKGVKVFSVFKHSQEAKNVGLDMNEAEVVVFGAPKAGTPLMQCQSQMALELPLKFLIYKDGDTTIVAYDSIKNIAARYDTNSCKEQVDNLSKAQENFFKAVTK